MTQSMLVTLGLGFLLGLKHATEADHLVAVSTIVSERRSIWQAAGVGALWGVGHTASLLLAGLLVVALGVVIPARVANLLELAVALMIIFLGTRLLYVILRPRPHSHVPAHVHGGNRRWRPVLVGIVHGLAGSAALTLLVLSEVVRNGSSTLGVFYLLVFGIGSITGMLLMSGLIGVPISLGIRFFHRTLLPMRVVAGISSTSFGVFYAFKVVEKLAVF